MKRILFPLAFAVGLAAAALSGMHSSHTLAVQHIDIVQTYVQHID